MTIHRTKCNVFVCLADDTLLNHKMLQRVPVDQLNLPQTRERLHPRLRYATRDEVRQMQELAYKVPIVHIDDLLTSD